MGASGGGGGGKSGAGASAGSGLGASATTGAASTPAATSGLGAAQSTPVSAVQQAGGIQSGSQPVGGIATPGAQNIINQISPTTTPESSQAVVPSAQGVATATEAANVGGNPAQGALDVAAKSYTGGLIGAGAGNTSQSALPAMGQMTGMQGQSVSVPQSAPGITSTSPIGAVPTSPKGPGFASRAGSSILESLGINEQNRQQVFQDAVLQLAQQGKSNTTQSELPQVGGGGGQPSLAEIIQQLGLRQMADGGQLAPGETAVVGEEGPEIAQGTPGGGARITPMRQLAQVPPQAPPGGFQRLVTGLQDALIFAAGLQNPMIFANARAASAEQERKLAELGLKHPELLESSPAAARAATSLVGQQGAEAVLRGPDVAERSRFEAAGLVEPDPAAQPGQGLAPEQRRAGIEQARKRGLGVRLTTKGTEISVPEVQRKDLDAAKAYAKLHSLVNDQGKGPVEAAQIIIGDAAQNGDLVPDPIMAMSNADNDRELKGLLAEAEADARNLSEQRFAAGTAAERTTGERGARILNPLSKEEIASAKAKNRVLARENVRNAIDAGELRKENASAALRGEEARLNYELDSQSFYGSELGGPVQPTPAAARDTLNQNFSASRNLDRMVDTITVAALGPAKGRFGTVKEYMGALGPQEARFRSEIESFRRAYVFAISGKQTNEFEQRRLDKMLNINQSPTQFAASLEVLANELDTKYQADANTLLANNERVPAQFRGKNFDSILGIEPEQAAPEQQAPPPATGGARMPAGPKNRVSQEQAAREIGATLQGLKAELQSAVKAGEISSDQAMKIYNRAEAQGALPAQ